ncbi:MAG: hypothetical protein U9P00_14755 [Pseudomonadota bacterium]|nr:hypothetical protein [Pseudomonadota bacterium]
MKGYLQMATLDPNKINHKALQKPARRIWEKYGESPRSFSQEYLADPPRRRHKRMADYNHCLSGGSGMSKCSACDLKDKDKIIHQKKCNFYKKTSFANNCRWEVFGEYCWNIEAQDASKKG